MVKLMENQMIELVKKFPPFSKVFYTKENRGGTVRGYFCTPKEVKVVILTASYETLTLPETDLEPLMC